MSFNSLPPSFFECVGRLDFIQENWYLEGPLHIYITRCAEVLSSLVASNLESTPGDFYLCDHLRKDLEWITTQFEKDVDQDTEEAKALVEALNHGLTEYIRAARKEDLLFYQTQRINQKG